MRNIFLSLLFLIYSSTLVGQTGCIDCNPDSLVKLLNSKLSDTNRLYTLVALADMIVLPANPDSALNCINQILKLNNRLKLVDTKPHELIRDGLVLWEKKNGDSAIEKFKDAISVFDSKKKILGNNSLLNTIREFYNYRAAHEDRLKFYEEKLRYYWTNGPVENMAVCWHGIAGYYYFKSDYNQAIGNYLKAAEIFKRFSYVGYSNEITVVGLMYSKWGNNNRALYWLTLADSLNQHTYSAEGNLELDKIEIAKIYKRKNQYTNAMKFGKQALFLSNKDHHPDRDAIDYTEIAGIFLQMNQPDSAFKFLCLAKQLAISNPLFVDGPSGPFELEFYLYQYYFLKNDLRTAERELILAYIKALKVKSNQLVLKYSKELSEFYHKNNEGQKALKYLQKYVQLNDSLNALQSSTEVAQYENEQRENQSLDQIKTMKKAEHSERRYYLLVSFFLFLIFVGLFSRIQYIRKTKKHLQAQNRIIEKEKQRAEQSEKFKEQFLANMSHEIRTPMNAVMGMTNLLIDKNPREDQYQYLDGIKKSSDTLLHIINDILDLSKIEAGKIELEKIDFSLNEVIRQVSQTLQHKAEEKGLRLITLIDDKIPDVLIGDPVRLNQILMNLTGNAIKYTEKGTIEIRVLSIIGTSLPENAGVLSVARQEGILNATSCKLQFSVSDTGIGIPKEKLQRIFESFTQASTSDTRRFGGTGLGLTISKQMVELMGGEIHVDSVPDSGSTFSFVLQMEKGSDERLRQRISSEEDIDGTILNGLKILIVDDNEYNRIVATDTLKTKAKLDIITASDGREAIEMLKQNDFDMVLMDVQMPGMDGFEATKYIRENLLLPKKDVPIVALTASVLRSDLDKCRQAGMNSYIPKPFKASQLIRGIADALKIEIRTMEKTLGGQSDKVFSINNTSVTNFSYLRNFCEDDPERIQKYVNMFLKSAPLLIERLNVALLKNDLAEIASQVHGYKTELIMMGMNETKELGTRIELQYAEGNNKDQVKDNVLKMLQQIEMAIGELKEGNHFVS